jgi:hypothetical protein
MCSLLAERNVVFRAVMHLSPSQQNGKDRVDFEHYKGAVAIPAAQEEAPKKSNESAADTQGLKSAEVGVRQQDDDDDDGDDDEEEALVVGEGEGQTKRADPGRETQARALVIAQARQQAQAKAKARLRARVNTPPRVGDDGEDDDRYFDMTDESAMDQHLAQAEWAELQQQAERERRRAIRQARKIAVARARRKFAPAEKEKQRKEQATMQLLAAAAGGGAGGGVPRVDGEAALSEETFGMKTVGISQKEEEGPGAEGARVNEWERAIKTEEAEQEKQKQKQLEDEQAQAEAYARARSFAERKARQFRSVLLRFLCSSGVS